MKELVKKLAYFLVYLILVCSTLKFAYEDFMSAGMWIGLLLSILAALGYFWKWPEDLDKALKGN